VRNFAQIAANFRKFCAIPEKELIFSENYR